MKSVMVKPSRVLLALAMSVGIGVGYWIGRSAKVQPPGQTATQPIDAVSVRTSTVSALGTLEPAGGVHVLAGAMTQIGGAPRIKTINVREGDNVYRNEILATFDNTSQITAEKARITANIESKKMEIRILKSQTKRFEHLTATGAFPVAELEEKKARLAGFESQLQELLGSLKTYNERLLVDTVIRAPIDGVVLRVNGRVGERPMESGVIEIGNIEQMQAVIQVDESEISSIRVGQPVTVRSENGAFDSTLHGHVTSIGMKVSAKQKLGSDPILPPDSEERVIEVKIDLDRQSSRKTNHLSGVKVMAIINIT